MPDVFFFYLCIQMNWDSSFVEVMTNLQLLGNSNHGGETCADSFWLL